MRFLKLALGMSIASLSFFPLTSPTFAESTSEIPSTEIITTSNNNVNVNQTSNEQFQETQNASIQSTSASFSLSNFASGSQGNTGTTGEFKSNNSINWSSGNKTVTLKVNHYEHRIINGQEAFTNATIAYDLISQNGNRAGSKTLSGNYFSQQGTVTWTNVKPGTYNLIIRNVGTGYASAFGNFSVQ